MRVGWVLLHSSSIGCLLVCAANRTEAKFFIIGNFLLSVDTHQSFIGQYFSISSYYVILTFVTFIGSLLVILPSILADAVFSMYSTLQRVTAINYQIFSPSGLFDGFWDVRLRLRIAQMVSLVVYLLSPKCTTCPVHALLCLHGSGTTSTNFIWQWISSEVIWSRRDPFILCVPSQFASHPFSLRLFLLITNIPLHKAEQMWP